MQKIGEYQYPHLSNFTETLGIANEALNRFGGFMPYLNVVQKLGYNIKNPRGISGYIYRRFDDMVTFDLFKRERGGIRATELSKQALDPYNQENGKQAKARSIRNVVIIGKAYDDWNGQMPQDDAFAGKLSELAGVDWLEAKKHVEPLKALFSDCFRYLEDSKGLPSPMSPNLGVPSKAMMSIAPTMEVRGIVRETRDESSEGGVMGELRTTIGSVVIRNPSTIKLARNLLDVLAEEMEKTSKGKVGRSEKTGGKGSGDEKDPP